LNEEFALSLGLQALQTVLLLAGPILIATMSVGLAVSVFQAVTQINEATLTFIPKIMAVILVLLMLGSWMLGVLQDYTIQVLGHAGEWIR
jgi:flagellar biosynthesis protein FliQ